MKLIKPSYEILTEFTGNELKEIEKFGRTCYKSEDKITEDSAEKFVRNLIKRGHESVLEHKSFTVKFICDRGISHELVRHRIASFSQESTRYCDYSKEAVGNELTFIQPFYMINNQIFCKTNDVFNVTFENYLKAMEDLYFAMLKAGYTPQEARCILPNCLKTEVVMTANYREWRHFFKLRTAEAAHPQMRELTVPLLYEMKRNLPVIFEDIDAIVICCLKGDSQHKLTL